MRAESAERREACVERRKAVGVFTLGLSEVSWVFLFKMCSSASLNVFKNKAMPQFTHKTHTNPTMHPNERSSSINPVLMVLRCYQYSFLQWLFWPVLIDFSPHRESAQRYEHYCCSREGQEVYSRRREGRISASHRGGEKVCIKTVPWWWWWWWFCLVLQWRHTCISWDLNLHCNLISVLLLDCPTQVVKLLSPQWIRFCSLHEKDDAKQKKRRSLYQFKLLT